MTWRWGYGVEGRGRGWSSGAWGVGVELRRREVDDARKNGDGGRGREGEWF
mgnify:CR=1 FL=1